MEILTEHVSYEKKHVSSSFLQVDIYDVMPSGADTFSQLNREPKVVISDMDV